MSGALVFATEWSPDGTPTGLLPLGGQGVVIDRVLGQLRTLGKVEELRVVTRPADAAAFRERGIAVIESADPASDLALIAEAARTVTGSLIVAAADLVAHDGALLPVLSPRVRSTVGLVGSQDAGGQDASDQDAGDQGAGNQPAVRCERGRITAVGSTWHRATGASGTFGGLIKIGSGDLEALARACDDLADFAPTSPVGLEALAGSAGTTGVLLLALVRGGTSVGAHRVRQLISMRVTSPAAVTEAERALAAVDEPATRLRLAVKEHDDLFTTFFVSSYSPRVVRLAARLGLTPNTVTWISIGFAALSATAFALGTRPMLILGAALLYVGFLCDCVDGQLARYTLHYSPFGGWLDTMADRSKEYLVYGGLALGAGRVGLGNLWIYALAAVVLQTVRHMTDTWYGALQDSAVVQRQRAPLDARDHPAVPGGAAGTLTDRIGGTLAQLSDRMQSRRGSLAYWFKRTIVFPIGERWAVIMVTAALFDARVTFACILGWATIALGYTLTGRILRTRSMRVATLSEHPMAIHRDDGPIVRWLTGLVGGQLPPLLPIVAIGGATAAVLLNDLLSWGLPGMGPGDHLALVVLAALLVLAGVLTGRNPHTGPLDWLVPAALRAAEYLLVLAACRQDGVPRPVVFALLFAIVLYHYDLAGRLDKRSSPLRVRELAFGWDGRVLIIVIMAVAGVAETGAVVFTGYLLALFAVQGLRGMVAARRDLEPQLAAGWLAAFEDRPGVSCPAQRRPGTVSASETAATADRRAQG
ncbi:MAG: CDP-alcohol phosphatidyltransferase family protein [Micromonosporaceae bacterium]|nr:CDP-alcohol phosphatidyltransferase family protein [Micromonosporaceae bacterium]